MDEVAAWMWLSDTADSQTEEALRLLEKFSSPQKVAEAKPDTIRNFVSERFAAALKRNRPRYESPEATRRLADLITSGGNLTTLHESDFPQQLQSIANPPLILFRRGSLRTFQNTIAVIGTRSPTHRGYTVGRKIAELLASEGYCIVSGLARGTDTMAYCGALDAGGTTVAVLPGPLTFLYPPENEFLARDIERRGALLAENSPMVSIEGRPAQRYRWVNRNRITSGLSEAVVVVEATDVGGSMHQVRFASEQGRPTFILRPDADVPSPLRRGYEKAVAVGARPFTDPEDLLTYLRHKPNERQSTLDA